MLDEHRLGHHGAGAAGTGESGNGRQHMQKQDAQITHRRILPRWRHGQECSRNLEFAMHTQHGRECGEDAGADDQAGELLPWCR